MSDKWTAESIPDLTDKVAIVTGANSGTGYEVTRALSRKDASVIMACRNLDKAKTATAHILNEIPDASLDILHIDLSDLSSVRNFAQEVSDRYQSLHILCNNAGIMFPPYMKTADGFELQFGTNYLGHFALTGILMEKLLNTKNSRIVTMTSRAHHLGEIDFNNLNWEKSYSRIKAYCQSKLANLLFAYELQRRLEALKSDVISVASDPGWSATNLQSTGLKMGGGILLRLYFAIGNPLFAQRAAMGALPMLYAATAPDVAGGECIGPDGWRAFGGHPTRIPTSERSHDKEVAQRLWEISEELTGVRYEALKR